MAEEVKNEETVAVQAPVNENENKEQNTERKGRNSKGGKFDRTRKPRGDRAPREAEEFEKRMVDIRSVQKTVKGGRILSFSALCVVGDKKGRVGIGTGKAREATNAIEKGFSAAKKNMINVSMEGNTIPHAITMKYGACTVRLMPAKEGTGVIAGGAARPVLELAGIKDITSKNQGSSNKINTVRATFEALKTLRTKEEVAALRGKTVEEL
ncbi:MAG: 30S ribosomal protein S5 [Clostridia bacterium]|nr:30S ribosomal protein S5 [Clostridia bacterium]